MGYMDYNNTLTSRAILIASTIINNRALASNAVILFHLNQELCSLSTDYCIAIIILIYTTLVRNIADIIIRNIADISKSLTFSMWPLNHLRL